MRKKISLFVFLIIGLVACTSGRQPRFVEKSGTGILVIDEIVFAKKSAVRKAVRDECRLPEKLAEFIDEYAAEHYGHVLTNTDLATVPANTEVLKVKYVEVLGGAGGVWSGGKYISIAGVLKKNEIILGDFKARRTCGGGMFGAYKGTCSIMKGCLKALGKDVAEWLQHHPEKNDVLGEY